MAGFGENTHPRRLVGRLVPQGKAAAVVDKHLCQITAHHHSPQTSTLNLILEGFKTLFCRSEIFLPTHAMPRLYHSCNELHTRHKQGDLNASFDVCLCSDQGGDALGVSCGLLQSFSLQLADMTRTSSSVSLDVDPDILGAFVHAMYGKGLESWMGSVSIQDRPTALLKMFSFGHKYEILDCNEALTRIFRQLAAEDGLPSNVEVLAKLYHKIPIESTNLHDKVFEAVMQGKDTLRTLRYQLQPRHFDLWAQGHMPTIEACNFFPHLYHDIWQSLLEVLQTEVSSLLRSSHPILLSFACAVHAEFAA